MTYQVSYVLAWINAAVGVVAGALSAAYLLPQHPSWLTSDIALTCVVIVTIVGGLAALLPQVTRTPAKRETKYLAAMAGALPEDLHKKHKLSLIPRDTPPPA